MKRYRVKTLDYWTVCYVDAVNVIDAINKACIELSCKVDDIKIVELHKS